MVVAQLRGVTFAIQAVSGDGFFPQEGHDNTEAWRALADVAHWLGMEKEMYNSTCEVKPDIILTAIQVAV